MMERNESTRDRVLHGAAGIAMLSMAFIGPRSVWAVLGVIPLLSGLLGFDPVYRILKISTRVKPGWPRKDEER
jgi:hypothetical protein